MNGDSNAVLWISLALIAIVLTHQYSSTVKGMLFDPDFWQRTTTPSTGSSPTPTPAPSTSGAPSTPAGPTFHLPTRR